MRITMITDGIIEFDNGTTIGYYHRQSCCENVYADWHYLENYNVLPATGESITIYDIDFDDLITNNIEFEKDMGIKLVSKDGSKWFIPCYNEQNGYYDDSLSLIFHMPGKPEVEIDITEYVEDRIY